jgi:putative phosphoesterase
MRLLIAVIGDTHGQTQTILNKLEEREKPDYLLCTGDYYADGKELAARLGIKFAGVRGNCDYGRQGSLEKTIELAGCRLYITHGHRYKVKSSLNSIYYRGLEIKADAVIFGHTHVPYCNRHNGMWLINPGSSSRGRLGSGGSYARLIINDGVITPEIVKW